MKFGLISEDKNLINKININFKKDKKEIHIFTSFNQLLNSCNTEKINYFIIDLEIGDIKFYNYIKVLRMKNSKCKLIFMYNESNFLYNALDYNSFHFMRKENLNKEFKKLYKKIEKSSARQNSLYTANTGKRTCTFKVEDVLYIESKKNYCDFVMKNRVINIRGTLCEFEEKFSNMGFIRIHSGYIVNFKYISVFEKNDIFLSYGGNLPVSRSKYKNSLKQWEYFCDINNINF